MMRQNARFEAIVRRLSEAGSIGVRELATALEVSPATIRRDLQTLEEQRLLARTHGGATTSNVLYELPLRYKAGHLKDEKRRIAGAAAARVEEGMAIGLTGGTTTMEVARAVSEHAHLTVVTNSLSIGSELAVRPNLRLVVTGGVARSASYELVGPLADATLASLNLDIAFVGVDGIDVDAGLTTYHEAEAHTNRAMIARARSVVVVSDHSKLTKVAFAQICELAAIHEVVCDTGAEPCAVANLRSAGITVTLV